MRPRLESPMCGTQKDLLMMAASGTVSLLFIDDTTCLDVHRNIYRIAKCFIVQQDNDPESPANSTRESIRGKKRKFETGHKRRHHRTTNRRRLYVNWPVSVNK